MKWNALLKRELHPILTQPKIASQTKLLIDTKTKQTNKNKLYKVIKSDLCTKPTCRIR